MILQNKIIDEIFHSIGVFQVKRNNGFIINLNLYCGSLKKNTRVKTKKITLFSSKLS